MKKLSTLLIIAFALVLGLTQCKKKVDTIATPNNLGEAVYITVNVSGDKHIVYPGTGAVVYGNGDKIYVGNNGTYVGTLTYADGKFSGIINSPSTADYLHFYFLGGLTPSATPVPGTTPDFTVSIADQSTQLPVLSYGRSTAMYTDGNATYGCTLLNKCGLVKFVPATATSETVRVHGMKTTAKIDFATPGITPTDATGTITLYPEPESDAKWAILLPQDEVSTPDGMIGQYGCIMSKVPEVTENLYSISGVSMTVKPGMLSRQFTINSDGDKVRFSQGNLQYIGSATTPYWKFADNQYEYFGNKNGQHGSSASDIDRDLFGWGTSGYDHGTTCYQPWSTSKKSSEYNPYGSLTNNLYDGEGDNKGKADWGYNAISNGGNEENFGWRTLTKDEWVWVWGPSSAPNPGHNCRKSSTVNNVENARFAKAYLFGSVHGVILFPDNYTHPEGVDAPEGVNVYGSTSWDANQYNVEDWGKMEAAGCVFLPAAGIRDGSSVTGDNSSGYYWSSNYSSNDNGYNANFQYNNFYSSGSNLRNYGFSVRLVF